MKLRPIKFVHTRIKYKISQVTNFECPASPPFALFSLALSLSDYSIWQSACVKRANEYK